MITSWPGGRGTVVATLGSTTPTAARLIISDSTGRLVVRRRFHERSLTSTLAPGRHTFVVEDERSLSDPRRLAGTVVVVDVPTDGPTDPQTDRPVAEVALHLVPGAVLRVVVTADGVPARFARVHAAHGDGQVIETRADGHGTVALCGLRAGTWTLDAADARRTRCSPPLDVVVGVGCHESVRLDLDTATSELLVRVRGTGRRSVAATTVTATGTDGGRVTAPLVDGQAHLRGLRAGTQTVTVPASVGHLGTEVVVEGLAPGELSLLEAVVPIGASICGWVVDDGARGQYAAVVTLVDADGTEVERVRTDDGGRFVLGRGLGTLDGLTVVATSGPETLHVTRAAHCDLALKVGVRQDVGQIVLPATGQADWTPLTPAIAAMKLPSTRV